MTIKVYVDWSNSELLSEAEYKEKVRVKTEQLIKQPYEFNDWLEAHYLPQEIWHLTEAGRIEIQGLWEQYCKVCAEEFLDFEEKVLEV